MDSSLEQFIHSVSGDQYFRVEDDLGNGFVRLRAAEAQRRQALQDIRSFEDVILELLRNSRDAHARAIFLATWTEGSKRFATILDNGEEFLCQCTKQCSNRLLPLSLTHFIRIGGGFMAEVWHYIR